MKLLFLLLVLPLLMSFKFNPMSTSIELSEDQKNAQFFVENNTPESMAVEFTVKERIMDEEGKETLSDAPGMAIFPPQIIIPSNEKRTIRLTWNGDKNIAVEKSFRVIAEQLPLDVNKKNKKKSGIQMLMRYIAALYVTPKEAQSNLSGSIEKVGNNFKLVITNNGNRHQVMVRPSISFKKNGEKWTLKGAELKGIEGENILAKNKRIFKLVTSQSIPLDSEVTIKTED